MTKLYTEQMLLVFKEAAQKNSNGIGENNGNEMFSVR